MAVQDMLIDVTRLASRRLEGRLPTGVDRVSLEYVAHYGAAAHALVRYGGRWLVLNEKDSKRTFRALLDHKEDFGSIVRWCVGRAYLFDWGGSHRSSFFLNTGHSGLHEPGYGEEIIDRGFRAIFVLHDLIPITHPEYCRPGEANKHRRRLATMIKAGRGLIVNSGDTLGALEKYAREEGTQLPPCRVAPLAPASLPEPAGQPLDGPYFVVLGTIEPRKNHLLLLHVWRQLVEEMGEAAPRLVIIGQRGWECEQVVDLLDRSQALNGYVVEKGGCSDDELATWLFHARALLFPSFTEGFGMPMIEALALGVPVVASDLAVFHEAAGDIPEYLDPLDGPGWKRAILEYMDEDGASRQAQRRRMQGYSAPTWENHFKVVDEFLAELDAR